MSAFRTAYVYVRGAFAGTLAETDEGYAFAFEELAGLYAELAGELGVGFVDTAGWGVQTAGDGVHFSERGHRIFAVKMAQTVRALLMNR